MASLSLLPEGTTCMAYWISSQLTRISLCHGLQTCLMAMQHSNPKFTYSQYLHQHHLLEVVAAKVRNDVEVAMILTFCSG